MITRFIDGNVIMKNEKLLNLYKVFKLSPLELLPVTAPPHVTLKPFQYHSTVNQDPSYISHPRLSVTKLLTRNWCELREYYNVYAGSIRTKPSVAVQLGLKYHETLELEDFEIINIEEFMNLLNSKLAMANDFDAESLLAQDWLENIVVKLYSLITRSHTRELLVHGYLDINHQQLDPNPTSADLILVSGIIDRIRLYNESDVHDLSLMEDIQTMLEFDPYITPQGFAESVKEIISANNYHQQYKLQFADVKTRQYNSIPLQHSVRYGAYLQVSYYKYFFDRLILDPNVCYNMMLENAKRRGCDLDKPIDIRIVLGLLRKYPHILLKDFTIIANQKSENPCGYNLTEVIDEKDIDALNETDAFDYHVILNHDILRYWSQPLTLRYFAKLCSLFFSIFTPFQSSKVSVEYHNVLSNYNFKTLDYQYDWTDLKALMEQLSQFWNGTKAPQPTNDLTKCKYCEFNSKCPVPNRDMSYIGSHLAEFLR